MANLTHLVGLGRLAVNDHNKTSPRFHEALQRVASASCDRLHVVSCDAYEIDFIKVTMRWMRRKFLDNEEEHVVSYDDP